MSRPYILLSASISLDGYLDSACRQRLVLSNDADLDRIDEVRASCDAIMVGAGTVRADNPRLLVRDQERKDRRLALGLPAAPMKVTVTARGGLDPASRFFSDGDSEKRVYCTSEVVDDVRKSLGSRAKVVDAGSPVSMQGVSEDLFGCGVRRLMVEGGSRVHTQFLTAGLADELQLVMAPLFVGDSRAPRFVGDGSFPWDENRRAVLDDVRRIGDVVLLRYALSDRYEA